LYVVEQRNAQVKKVLIVPNLCFLNLEINLTCMPDLISQQCHAQVKKDDAITGRAQHLDKVPEPTGHIIIT
jgi:hypothetical protein